MAREMLTLKDSTAGHGKDEVSILTELVFRINLPTEKTPGLRPLRCSMQLRPDASSLQTRCIA